HEVLARVPEEGEPDEEPADPADQQQSDREEHQRPNPLGTRDRVHGRSYVEGRFATIRPPKLPRSTAGGAALRLKKSWISLSGIFESSSKVPSASTRPSASITSRSAIMCSDASSWVMTTIVV